MLTIKDVMDYFKVSRSTVYRWMEKGLKSEKIEGVRRFDAKDIKHFRAGGRP